MEAAEQLVLVSEQPIIALPGGSWSVARRVIRPNF
jgi:hypothetical protein